jgi:hypothetical protein
MLARSLKLTVTGVVVIALAAPSAVASAPSQSALGAKTEGAGYTAINHYLAQRGQQALSPARIAVLGAKTEAKGYRALVRYQAQPAATPVAVSETSPGFSWRDALVGAALTAGLALMGAAATLTLRRRRGVARHA